MSATCDLAVLSFERPDRSVAPEGLQDPQHLHADRMISTQAAERDAPLCPVVHASAMAEIAACLAALSHMQLATAVPAAQQTREETFPAAHRPFYQRTFAGRIVGYHTLVPLELAPRDVTLVPVREQHIPFRLRTPQPAPDTLAPLLDARPCSSSGQRHRRQHRPDWSGCCGPCCRAATARSCRALPPPCGRRRAARYPRLVTRDAPGVHFEAGRTW